MQSVVQFSFPSSQSPAQRARPSLSPSVQSVVQLNTASSQSWVIQNPSPSPSVQSVSQFGLVSSQSTTAPPGHNGSPNTPNPSPSLSRQSVRRSASFHPFHGTVNQRLAAWKGVVTGL